MEDLFIRPGYKTLDEKAQEELNKKYEEKKRVIIYEGINIQPSKSPKKSTEAHKVDSTKKIIKVFY